MRCNSQATAADASSSSPASSSSSSPMSGTPRFIRCTPPGDERERDMCGDCGFVNYQNPKVVVGAIPVWTDSSGVQRVLLAKRAIEPRVGKWGFPQGFMELGESTREGAARESMEEAGAVVHPGPLLAVYNLPGSVQLLYMSTVGAGHEDPDLPPQVDCGHESLEAGFFTWDELPEEEELAFPTVKWALDYASALTPAEMRGDVGFVPQQRTKLIFGPGGFVEETTNVQTTTR